MDRPRSRQRLQPRGIQGRRGGQQDPRSLNGARAHRRDLRTHRRDALPQPAVTIKLNHALPLAESTRDRRRARVGPYRAERARATLTRLTPAAVTGTLDIAVGRIRHLAMGGLRSPRSPSATSSCGAPPSRCGACCGCSTGADPPPHVSSRARARGSAGCWIPELRALPVGATARLDRRADADRRRRLAGIRDHRRPARSRPHRPVAVPAVRAAGAVRGTGRGSLQPAPILALCTCSNSSARSRCSRSRCSARAVAWPVFAVMALFGVARAFSMPAGQAIMPNLVPRALFVARGRGQLDHLAGLRRSRVPRSAAALPRRAGRRLRHVATLLAASRPADRGVHAA